MREARIGRVQPITKEGARWGIEEQVRAFCRGGADWVQLRLKQAGTDEFLRIAEEAREITSGHGSLLILDDRVDLVKKVGADGVHLGETDMDPGKAREKLGKDAIIGGTADRFERIEELASKTDYIGCGPYRFTDTKKGLSPILGLDGYRSILEGMDRKGIRIPLLAIGGVRVSDIPLLMQAGVFGIAVSSIITGSEDPVLETSRIIEKVEAHTPS
jgi:thiamine-phosphate pyrophosphorylase